MYKLRKGTKNDFKGEKREKKRVNLNLFEHQVEKLDKHPESRSKIAREILDKEIGEENEQ